jgi:propanediol utilization protein
MVAMNSNMNNTVGIISKVAGPLIIAKNMKDVQMYDVVRVSEKFQKRMHVDVDEANAAGLKGDVEGEIIV